MIGTTISHYKILSPLGQGGMGVVYLAEDMILHRKAVLKFLLPQYLAEPELNARLLREARAAAALNHPNIITIYEVGEARDQIFIAMEYVEGESLRDLLARKDLTLNEVFDLTAQICEGLAEAHRAGIVHRDLKPSNILLNKAGRVKIADFGLARLEGVTKLTIEGAFMGTLDYMSPEQANSQPLDQRSDIFSLGVILYELITHQLPFRGRDTLAVWRAITGQEPEPLARYKANVSDGLQRMINRALDKNVETRYQHVEDLLADLKDEKKILFKTASSIPAQPKRVEPTMTIAAPPPPKIEKRAEDKAPNLCQPPDEKASKPRRPIAAPPLPKIEKRAEDKAPILPRDKKTAKRKFWPIAIVSGVVLLLALWVISNMRDQKIENEPPAATKTPPPTGMAFIPAGYFLMGSSDYDDEKPEHQVYVDAFYMDKYEVTLAQYQQFISATRRATPEQWAEQLQNPNRPVVYVSWNDAVAYAKWKGKRLPTEAEWEYATRGGYTAVGGKAKYKYPWGNDAVANKANFDFAVNRGGDLDWENAEKYLKNVASYAPNGYGLYDMAGNVWEWCSSLYQAYPYKRDDGRENSTASGARVLRGGAWYNAPSSVRCAERASDAPTNRFYIVGFRCVQDVR